MGGSRRVPDTRTRRARVRRAAAPGSAAGAGGATLDVPKLNREAPSATRPTQHFGRCHPRGGGRTLTCFTTRPYENGEMFSMLSSVASEAPTLSPGFKMWTSLMISMVPAHRLFLIVLNNK